MATQKKTDTVQKLSDKASKAKSMIFADYTGIKHKQLEELRREMKKANGEFTVTKNKLLMRALGPSKEALWDTFKHATATVYAYEDEVAPVKVLMKFFKSVGMGTLKGGVMGSTLLSVADVTRLSQLPTRDVLLGKLVRQLNAPIQGFHYALSWNLNKLVWALSSIKAKKAN